MYPQYIIVAETIKPDALDAPSKVVKPAPMDRNIAVMHIVVCNHD